MARAAQWAFAVVYLAIAVLAIVGGFQAVNPPAGDPNPFTGAPGLPPPVTQAMWVTATFFFITGAAFLAATAAAVLRTRKEDADGAVSAGLNVAFAAALVSIGFYLTWKGIELVSIGGSFYYALSGVALIATAVLLVMRNPWGPRVYAAILALTVVWSVVEAGLDFIALLPRLAAWTVVGFWFISPWHKRAMQGSTTERVPSGGRWVAGAAGLAVGLLIAGALQGYKVEQGTDNKVAGNGVTDWRAYGNVPGGQRFAQIDQINLANVGELEEVWRYRTGVPYDFKQTPQQVGDLVYICTAGNTVIALDSDTGAEKWRRDTQTVIPARDNKLENASTFARTCRSVGYYEAPPEYTGECAKRILTGTVDARLLALDALTGAPCKSFGFDGAVSLKAGLGPHPPGMWMNTSGPLIAGNIAVLGGWVTDNQQLGNVSGVIRAYDTMTGEFKWAWDMGNPDFHGLPDEGGEYTRGTPNVWSLMSYDPQLNMIYAPTGNSSPDYFDGDLRTPQAESFASSVVAIDAATGAPKWHFQTVHRDIWDWDVPSQPVLVDVKKDGQVIPAVAQPTKRGEIFLLDRRDGTPVYPIEERPVPQNPEVGEVVAPTQPFSPLPHFRPDRWEKDMWGITPLDQLWCRVAYKRLRYEGHFTPPMRNNGKYQGTFQYPGNAGGFNWGSVSVDADNGLLIASPMLMGNKITLNSLEDRAKAREEAQARAARARARAGDQGTPAAQGGPGGPGGPAAAPGQGGGGGGGQGGGGRQRDPRFDPQRVLYTANTAPFMSEWKLPLPFTNVASDVPCFEPPYSRMGVIDLNTNKLLWSRPLGSMRDSGPFGIATGLSSFMVGTPQQAGTLTTRGGLIFHGGAMDSTFRAFDLRSGKIKWQTKLPGSAHATPMSYMSAKTGKQYVVITVPNPSWRYPRTSQPDMTDDQGGYVIAYALKPKAQ